MPLKQRWPHDKNHHLQKLSYSGQGSRKRIMNLNFARKRTGCSTFAKTLNIHTCLIVEKCSDGEIDEEEATIGRSHKSKSRSQRAIATRIGSQCWSNSVARCFYRVRQRHPSHSLPFRLARSLQLNHQELFLTTYPELAQLTLSRPQTENVRPSGVASLLARADIR